MNKYINKILYFIVFVIYYIYNHFTLLFLFKNKNKILLKNVFNFIFIENNYKYYLYYYYLLKKYYKNY